MPPLLAWARPTYTDWAKGADTVGVSVEGTSYG
jgi:hypothetical protein